MKPHSLLILSAIAALTLSSCVVPGDYYDSGVSTVGVGYGTYATLPVHYTGDAYYYGGRYYSGGRYETGRYYDRGQSYNNRYYHNGRYYYGGRHQHYGSRDGQHGGSPRGGQQGGAYGGGQHDGYRDNTRTRATGYPQRQDREPSGNIPAQYRR